MTGPFLVRRPFWSTSTLLVAAGGLVLADAVSVNRNGDILAVGYDTAPSSGDHVHAAHERPRRALVLVPVH